MQLEDPLKIGLLNNFNPYRYPFSHTIIKPSYTTLIQIYVKNQPTSHMAGPICIRSILLLDNSINGLNLFIGSKGIVGEARVPEREF